MIPQAIELVENDSCRSVSRLKNHEGWEYKQHFFIYYFVNCQTTNLLDNNLNDF